MIENDRKQKSYEQEYYDMRKKILAKSPEERAKDKIVGSFIKMFFTASNFEPTAEQRVEVYKRVVKYFRENSGNIYPNVVIFRDIIKTKEISAYQNAGIKFVENCLATDYQYASRGV